MSARHTQAAEVPEWLEKLRAPLSPAAAKFARSHPQEAERVIAAALEDAAAARIPEGLARFMEPAEDADELLTVTEAAARLKVSRPTIYAWIEAKHLLAWRVTRRGPLIPAEQIIGPGELVPGIDRVLAIISRPRAAWRFLTEESPYFREGPRRPIDMLKTDRTEAVDAVVAAAHSYLSAFT